MNSHRRARDLATEMMRRAVAIELGHVTLNASVAELAVPGELAQTARHLARGMSRDDVLIMLCHMALMVRMFAAEVPVGRRDQMLAELDDIDAMFDQSDES